MQAGFTHTQGVKICQRACERDRCLTPICRNVEPEIFDLLNLKLMLCLFTMKQDQFEKLRAFSHLENRKKRLILCGWLL